MKTKKAKTKSRKMDPRVKALWVSALRSGNYKENRGSSFFRGNDDSYSPLGVLMDVYIEDTLDGEWVEMDYGKSILKHQNKWAFKANDGHPATYTLAQEVQVWAGMADAVATAEWWEPTIYGNIYIGDLTTKEYDMSFEEVAAAIEEEL